MIQDKDLDFLKQCSHQDLNNLVELLVYDTDGKKRISEQLSKCDGYKNHHPKHLHYYEEVVSELQCYGGNSIVNIARKGKGVLYREILEDVCSRYKIKYDKTRETESLENLLILTVIEHSLEKMSDEQRKEFLSTLGIKKISGEHVTKVAVAIAEQALTRYISGIAAGPIGLAIASTLVLNDVAGPAYRVTVPAVLEIAHLRQKYKKRQKSLFYKIKIFLTKG